MPTFHNWVAGWKGKFGAFPADTTVFSDLTAATFYDVEEFSFDHQVTTDDITNTGGGGAQDVIDCIESANGSLTMVYDASADPNVSPQSFSVRNKFWAILQPDGHQTYRFFALITKAGWKSGPKAGACRISVEFMSKGPIIVPTASQTAVTSEV
jgi:hypothetical protein